MPLARLAMALMEIGVKAPGDAFRAAQRFSHTGSGGASWVGDDGLADGEPERQPGLPYHFALGDTYIYVSGGQATVALHTDGEVPLAQIERALGKPKGFIAVNMSAVFAAVVHRMARDYREVLDEAYKVS